MVWLALLGVLVGLGCVGALMSHLIAEPGRSYPESFLPLGVVTVLLVALPLSTWLPMATISWGGAVFITIASATLLARARPQVHWRAVGRACGSPSFIAPIVTSAVAAIPLAVVGFPTSIAWATGDIYAYAANAEWMIHNSIGDVAPVVGDPASTWVVNQLAFGFQMAPEHLAAAFASLTGTSAYEWLGVILATGAGISVAGWLALLRATTGQPPTWPQAVGATAAGLVPPLITAMADGFASQFLAICLVPFVLAAWWSLLRRPGVRRAVLAALALAGSFSIYLGVLPWLLVSLSAIVGLALITPSVYARTRWKILRVVAAALAIAALLAPLQLARLATNFRFLLTDPGYQGFPGPTDGGLAAVATGTAWIGRVLSEAPLDTPLVIAVSVAVGALASIVIITAAKGNWGLVVMTIALTLTTVLFAYHYEARAQYPYGAYKTMISGGSLVLGIVIVSAFAQPVRRATRSAIGLVALGGVLIAFWIPVTATALDAQAKGAEGFRAPERAVKTGLTNVPAGSAILVESSSQSLGTFNMRMFALAMSASDTDLFFEGIGTTGIYPTSGGDPAWVPTRGWNYVLSNEPSLRDTYRSALLISPPYTIWRAPVLDLTTYGLGWFPSEGNSGSMSAWLGSPGEILASNSSSRPERAVVTANINVVNRRRVVTATVGGGTTLALSVTPGRPAKLRLPVLMPPHGVVRIALDATPSSETQVPTDSRPLLMRVDELRITALRVAR